VGLNHGSGAIGNTMSVREDLERARLGQLSFNFELDESAEDAEDRAITHEEARLISEAARKAFEVDPKPLGEREWYVEYLRLREEGWPWRVASYIAWAASPKEDRYPKTLQELATKVLGLQSPRSIYNWRKKYPTIDATISMMQALPLLEHRRDVIEALVEMAKTRDYKAFNDRKLFLEMVGDYIPKSQLGLGKAMDEDVVGSMSEAELRKWVTGEDGGSTNSMNEHELGDPQMTQMDADDMDGVD